MLILTDGQINDLKQTTEQLIIASKLPISIIIVGIGTPKCDFKNMRELDADSKPLRDDVQGDQKRDCV